MSIAIISDHLFGQGRLVNQFTMAGETSPDATTAPHTQELMNNDFQNNNRNRSTIVCPHIHAGTMAQSINTPW